MSNKNNQKKKESGRIYLILPAYNEEASLPNLLKRISAWESDALMEVKVVVIDDGSTDSTALIVKNSISELDINLISHEKNSGLGQAIQSGIKEVVKAATNEDIIVIMDADDTHDIELLNPMVDKIEKGADIVIASRFIEGGNDRSAPIFRRILSRGAALTFRTILPLNEIQDFTSGYRAYKYELLRRASAHWGERLIEEQGFACMVELLLKLRHWSPEIAEVPMFLRYDRKLSTSKLKLKKTLIQYVKLALRDRLSPPPRAL